MGERRFTAVFERDEAGFIYAHVPELPEVQTQGHTVEEAREMVRAAIEQALELRRERGDPIPTEGWAATEFVEVSWVKRRVLGRHLVSHGCGRVARRYPFEAQAEAPTLRDPALISVGDPRAPPRRA